MTYTYADLDETSGRFARALARFGVRPGDRVAAQVDKSPEALFVYLACVRMGAIFLPLNTAYQKGELSYLIGDAEPTVVVGRPQTEADLRRLVAQVGKAQVVTLGPDRDGSLIECSTGLDPRYETAVVGPDDVAAILYTSGTTGRPKGAMLTHRNLASNAAALHRIWGFRSDDVLLHALPIYHTHGLFVAVNCVLMNGTGMIFLPRFDADAVIRLLPRATVFMGVPTFYTRLLAHPGLTADACRNMRLFISGSAPLLEETFRDFHDRTGHTILERYGMSETGMNTSNPLDGERLPGTVGLPLPDVEVRVADADGRVLPRGRIGVLEIRGPNVFTGYWRNPEKTAEELRPDGFFITGDLARIDTNGYVSIVGRSKDLIISGGLNVYPKEIESAIDEDESVDESAVVGIPHPDFGEAVLAVVKPRVGADAPSGEAIIRRLKNTLANFKVPKKVVFIDELPRNAMGKVQKNLLRERFKDALETGE